MPKEVPKVALAVGGSIAAYKAVEIARRLIEQGIAVTPLLTEAAARFVGPLTFSGICGTPALQDLFDDRYAGEVHVELGRVSDAVLIAPASADLLARLSQGRASDLVSALALAAACPILVAPAMHARMWSHPATQRNVRTLRADGRVELVGPVDGPLASGESGPGRLAEPDDIVAAVLRALGRTSDLAGLRLVVTAGPTVEDLDPVRFLSNRSSGKMGFAVAERARARGAEVTLITGPVELAEAPGVARIDVRGALDMRAALASALGPGLSGADALIMAAAVADYTPREPMAHKLKKAGERSSLELVKTPDLLAELGASRSGLSPVLVGFAVETGDDDALVARAREKLRDKRVDLVVANLAADAFGRDSNRAIFVTEEGTEPCAVMTKGELSDRVLDRVRALAVARGLLRC